MRQPIALTASIAALLISSCGNAKTDLDLCPDLLELGTGNKRLEEGRRCVRVMAARYSVSGESPKDIATAAIEFCRDSKIKPIVDDVADLVQRAALLERAEGMLEKSAIRTVVEMRTGECLSKQGLFEGINDPIVQP